MHYGDEYLIEVPGGFAPDRLSRARLDALFSSARRVTRFASTPDGQFIEDLDGSGIESLLCYRIDRDSLIEINDTVLSQSFALRNEVADLVSFQFVSSVERAEYFGRRKNVHELGPALIVSAVPRPETTYRVPKANVPIRHVVVHATLSTLLERIGEDPVSYPRWLRDMLAGRHRKPRQTVHFLEDVHRDAVWSCFHRPVAGSLLGYWLAAKFSELLCIGLQVLKDSVSLPGHDALDLNLPYADKIRRARAILSAEYANPPPLPALARQLGISETRLKSSFRSMHGTTVMQYCIDRRIEAARLLLRENRLSIAEIGSIVGYEDHSAFSRAFRRHAGATPREWRRVRGA